MLILLFVISSSLDEVFTECLDTQKRGPRIFCAEVTNEEDVKKLISGL